jgi:Acetyltransferase (GNAT) domain
MIKNDTRVAGYGVIRPCYEGFEIGPLFSENADVADSLFQTMMCTAGHELIFIDMPEPNVQGLRMIC